MSHNELKRLVCVREHLYPSAVLQQNGSSLFLPLFSGLPFRTQKQLDENNVVFSTTTKYPIFSPSVCCNENSHNSRETIFLFDSFDNCILNISVYVCTVHSAIAAATACSCPKIVEMNSELLRRLSIVDRASNHCTYASIIHSLSASVSFILIQLDIYVANRRKCIKHESR